MRRLGWLAVPGLGVGFLLCSAGPSAAVLTSNDVGCTGSADVIGGDGRTYHLDAADATATVPREGQASWRGALGTVTHDHHGEVRLEVGPFSHEIGSWGPSPNTANQSSASGEMDVPSFMADVPTGRYKLSGTHSGAEGGCAGEVVVEVEGTPFSNVASVAGPVGTLLFGALLAFAARPKTRG